MKNLGDKAVFYSICFLYIASYALEAVFHMRYWDYGDYHFNYQRRIALASSLFFGLAGVILLYGVQPALKYIYQKLPPYVSMLIGACIWCIMGMDFILALGQYR